MTWERIAVHSVAFSGGWIRSTLYPSYHSTSLLYGSNFTRDSLIRNDLLGRSAVTMSRISDLLTSIKLCFSVKSVISASIGGHFVAWRFLSVRDGELKTQVGKGGKKCQLHLEKLKATRKMRKGRGRGGGADGGGARGGGRGGAAETEEEKEEEGEEWK